MDCIKQVETTYNKVSKAIQLQKQELSDKIINSNILLSQLILNQSSDLSQHALMASITILFKKLLTVTTIDQYNICNKYISPIITFFKKPLTAMDISQYNICNRCNDYQPASILVFNLISYCLTSKSWDNCKCILKRSIIPISLTKTRPIQILLIQTTSIQVSLAAIPLVQAPQTQIPSVQVFLA